jgi:alpha-L-fucosidase 2
MVFGGVTSERLQLSEKTMRSGRASAALGDLLVHIHDAGTGVDGYRRDLDLCSAVARIEYVLDGVRYHREHLASHPAGVIVSRFQVSQPSKLSLTVEFRPSQQGVSVDVDNGRITVRGTSPHNGLRFEAQILVVAEDGALYDGEDTVTIWEARAATVFLSAATDYAPSYPTYRGKDPHPRVTRRINTAASQPYATLRAAHIADHRRLFDRVTFDVGQPAVTDVPTDQALSTYDGVGPQARALEALYFHYGRYLAIASSRDGRPLLTPPGGVLCVSPTWTTDLVCADSPRNGWPVRVINLAETATLFADVAEAFERVRRSGAEHVDRERLDREHLDGAPGWCGDGQPERRSERSLRFLDAAAWLCRQMWEHYEFSGDRDFLRAQAYPVMADVAAIWLDILADGPADDRLDDSHSLEHGCVAHAGMSRWGVWDVLRHTLVANEVLDEDMGFRKRLVDALDRFAPVTRLAATCHPRTSTVDPLDDVRPLLHLDAVNSGQALAPSPAPDLAEPVRAIPRPRGPDDVESSKAWDIDRWARLGHGDHAHRLVRELLHESTPNLLTGPSPFHVDSAVNAAAGMAHLLLQSRWMRDEIAVHLLPALPSAWSHGRVSGLRARGGLTVDIDWRDARPIRVELAARHAITVRVRTQAFATIPYQVLDLATGRAVPHSRESDEVILRTAEGQVLRLTPADGEG